MAIGKTIELCLPFFVAGFKSSSSYSACRTPADTPLLLLLVPPDTAAGVGVGVAVVVVGSWLESSLQLPALLEDVLKMKQIKVTKSLKRFDNSSFRLVSKVCGDPQTGGRRVSKKLFALHSVPALLPS